MLSSWGAFPGGSAVKHLPAMQETIYHAEDTGSIPGSGRSAGGGHGNLLQCSCLGNPMDRGAWWAIVRGLPGVRHDLVTKPPLRSWGWSPCGWDKCPHKETHEHLLSISLLLPCEDAMRGYPWARKQALTRHWICQHLGLGLPRLWNHLLSNLL